MADAALALAPSLGLRTTIAHLDHGLRGAAARADAEFVSAFAERNDCPAIVDHVDVATLAREQHLSVEVAARHARYAFLAAAARTAGAAYIALAHNSDDQAETVLLRLLRGTGLSGLRGMQVLSSLQADLRETLPGDNLEGAQSLVLVRPLLGVSRAEIESYCVARALSPRRDTSNEEAHHTRNRVRHELLPLLERYNPAIRRVLVRLADTASSDLEIVAHATRQAFASVLLRESPQGITLDRIAWRQLSVGLQRATLREAVRELKHDLTNLKFAGVEEARDVLSSDVRRAEIALLADVRIVVTPRDFTLVWREAPNGGLSVGRE
jgi:tRNA(Ile)-lysidine synthase